MYVRQDGGSCSVRRRREIVSEGQMERNGASLLYAGVCGMLGEQQEPGPGTMLWAPRGARVEDLQSVMDPATAEEQKADVGGREGQRFVSSESSARLEASQASPVQRRRASWSSEQGREGTGRQGRRQENKQQDACLAALLSALHVQLEAEGIVSLSQYKQITHGPMEPAKHRVQCIQNHVSYEEHIRHIIDAAYSTKQLSLDARLDRERLKGEHRFNSLPQRPVFTIRNNCTPKLETREPRMCHVLSW